jgi:hypothetical protein
MDWTIVAKPTAQHQASHAAALANGLAAHGLSARITHSWERAETKRVACWGWRIGRQLRARGHSVLVMERGYLGDRFAWTSLAWNGLNNRGAVPPAPADGGERFDRHFGALLQPLNPGGEYALIVGQVPGDMSLRGRNLHPWYCEQARLAQARGLRPVFRPHPLAARRAPVLAVPGASRVAGDLAAALAGACEVITYNSNTGVDALIAGKPVTAADEGSMIWGHAGAREPLLHRIAWRQWTMDEIADGSALQQTGLSDG